MRLIFIVLLVGNIVFFAFQFFGRSDNAGAARSESGTRQFGNLQTLEERDGKNKHPAKIEAVKTEVAGESASSSQCQLVGPFVELLHAEYLVERLTSLDVASAIKHIEISDGNNFWVYLKPEMSGKEAMRRLNEIQAKSIDALIISEGELANGISFGQFSDQSSAKAKAEAIHAQGYPAEIKEVPKSHAEIWVEVKDASGQKISDEQWLALLKEEKAIERRQNYCLGVANP